MFARRVISLPSRTGCGLVARNYSRTAASSTEMSYTERQATLNRPVSPHVTIYAFPYVAIASITGRVTGVACAGKFLKCILFLSNNVIFLQLSQI